MLPTVVPFLEVSHPTGVQCSYWLKTKQNTDHIRGAYLALLRLRNITTSDHKVKFLTTSPTCLTNYNAFSIIEGDSFSTPFYLKT